MRKRGNAFFMEKGEVNWKNYKLKDQVLKYMLILPSHYFFFSFFCT
jgi:hypothetical protein